MLDPTILVVDDDDLIRELVSELLAEKYRILQASSVPEAIKLLEQVDIDLLLTDYHMPPHTGIELVASGIPAILMSGGLSNEELSDFGQQHPNLVMALRKPFDPQSLRIAVAETLESLE